MKRERKGEREKESDINKERKKRERIMYDLS